jgi:hypothetical protein
LSGIEQVPWSRIVHFYGRATEIPDDIRKLASDDHVEARVKLLNNLEHQDGVMQATPFAVWFIVRMLHAGVLRDPDGVRSMLRRFQRSAQFQISDRDEKFEPLDWARLLAEERLWPEFVSDFDDECRWEKSDIMLGESDSWAMLTDRFIADGLGAS